MIDKTIPYVPVFMQKNIETSYQTYPLPQGFSFSFYQKNDDIKWSKIVASVGEFKDENEAFNAFKSIFDKDEKTLEKSMLFINNDKGESIATGTLWTFSNDMPRLHYIAVNQTYQRRGLGKALISKLIELSHLYYPKKDIALTTQTWSFHAIKLYQHFGFFLREPHVSLNKSYDIKQAALIIKTKQAINTYHKNKNNNEAPLTIGIFAPSSPADRKDLHQGVQMLESLGFQVVIGKSCLSTHFDYLAGTDDLRIQDIHEMYQNPKVDLLMAMKGGYGTPRIADQLNYELISNHPKPLIGFSDVTLLLNLIYDHTKQITYHGPMVIGDFTYDFNETSYQSFLDLVLNQVTSTYDFSKKKSVITINKGAVEGRLVGGNLTLLSVLIQMVDITYFKGKVLLIEEVNESIYQIDRLLQILRVAGVFDQIQGLMIGTLSLKRLKDKEKALSLFKEMFTKYTIPVIYNVPIGHEKYRLTCKIGGQVKLNATQKTITFL